MKKEKQLHFEPRLQQTFEKLLHKDLLEEVIPADNINMYYLFFNSAIQGTLYEFEIFGEKGTYKPTFKVSSGILYSTCNCKAGLKDQYCWHRSYILKGKTTKVISHYPQLKLNEMIQELKNNFTFSNACFTDHYYSKPVLNFKRLKVSAFSAVFSWLF